MIRRIVMRFVYLLVLGGTLTLAGHADAQTRAEKPNILVIFGDDIGIRG